MWGCSTRPMGCRCSDYFPAGTESIIQKNSNGSINAVTPSEPEPVAHRLVGKRAALVGMTGRGCFAWETFFNPQSGDIEATP